MTKCFCDAKSRMKKISRRNALLRRAALTINHALLTRCGSRSGSVIRDHTDHGRSNQPMNPFPWWIRRFL